MSYCPRSSLPVEVLAWLADRLAHLLPPRPPRRGGTPPLALEVRLDAVAAVVLDGLSYRRAARMIGISKTEVGDSLDLLLGPLAAVGYCQPDGTFIITLADLRQWLGEMAASGEAVCVDGLATRVQRPRGWANQKVLYDCKRHAHTAQGCYRLYYLRIGRQRSMRMNRQHSLMIVGLGRPPRSRLLTRTITDGSRRAQPSR